MQEMFIYNLILTPKIPSLKILLFLYEKKHQFLKIMDRGFVVKETWVLKSQLMEALVMTLIFWEESSFSGW